MIIRLKITSSRQMPVSVLILGLPKCLLNLRCEFSENIMERLYVVALFFLHKLERNLYQRHI